MIVRDRRIFLVLDGMQVCILDHDGSRVLTTHHFKADDDPELFSKFFTNKGIVLIFPHPHDPDRFFLAVQGWLNRNPPDDDDEDEDEHSASEDDVDMEEPTKYLIVMEFAGSCHIATYHEAWPICSVEDEDICFSTEAEVLDDQGTYATGHWSIPRSDERALHFSGLPTPPEGFNYTIQTSFNTVTREFGIQSHLVPATLRAGRCGAPWALQDFIPHVPKPGVLNIRRFDAEDADVYPTRPSRPESKGERADFGRDWTIESSLIDEVMERTCQFFHDEDFTVMFLEESHLLYAWSYVDDKEAWNQARPSSALLEMRGEKPERPSVSFQEIREAISLD